MTATCACHKQCAGGHKCGCNGAVPHTAHICKEPTCECHKPVAWGLVKAVRRNGEEVYEHAPRVLEVGL